MSIKCFKSVMYRTVENAVGIYKQLSFYFEEHTSYCIRDQKILFISKLIVGTKQIEQDQLQLTGRTDMVMKSLLMFSVRELLIYLKYTHKMQK